MLTAMILSANSEESIVQKIFDFIRAFLISMTIISMILIPFEGSAQSLKDCKTRSDSTEVLHKLFGNNGGIFPDHVLYASDYNSLESLSAIIIENFKSDLFPWSNTQKPEFIDLEILKEESRNHRDLVTGFAGGACIALGVLNIVWLRGHLSLTIFAGVVGALFIGLALRAENDDSLFLGAYDDNHIFHSVLIETINKNSQIRLIQMLQQKINSTSESSVDPEDSLNDAVSAAE